MDLLHFHDKTPYTIMFGPDKCGPDAKIHFIFRHINPKNQSIEEKHGKKLETRERGILEEAIKDQRPHLYRWVNQLKLLSGNNSFDNWTFTRLIVRPDNTFEISIDYKIVNHGSLFEDFEPPVNPPGIYAIFKRKKIF